MPELPEVETMRRGALPIVGSMIRDISRPPCSRRPIEILPKLAVLRRKAIGTTIAGLGRVGKRVLVELSSGDRIVLEPRMSGLVLLADPPTRDHLRLRIELSGGTVPELLFWDRRGLGLVRLLSPGEFERHLGPDRIGPDALLVTPELLRERLGRSRRPIKVALLDQKCVAGIGNLYASEILHLAGIHPARGCHQLNAGEWQCIQAATLEILEDAIRHEGSTLSDGTYRNTLNQDGNYQNKHRVYDKAGIVCRRCGQAEISRIVQAQRSTFFCSVCQPRSRAKRRGPC